jgi:epoxyqueuosine reductase
MMDTSLVEHLLEDQGYKGRVVSTRRLSELRSGIEGPRTEGQIDEELYREYLDVLEFDPPASLPEARSLIVAAVPDPIRRISFHWEGGTVSGLVPPTYLHGKAVDQRVENVLTEALAPAGYRLARASIPKKLLAVRSGLSRYGRNNISYAPGLGSFYRLVAFHSDLPCPDDEWHEPRMLERCETCRACGRRCPTGAITAERFLLRAERCLTFHNEKPGEVEFPAWISPSAHNCLVGCLHCQTVCPENKDFVQWIVDAEEISQEETAELLEGRALDQLSAPLAEKVRRADLVDYLGLLPRNLKALLARIG